MQLLRGRSRRSAFDLMSPEQQHNLRFSAQRVGDWTLQASSATPSCLAGSRIGDFGSGRDAPLSLHPPFA
jgi:hypothetical protein